MIIRAYAVKDPEGVLMDRTIRGSQVAARVAAVRRILRLPVTEVRQSFLAVKWKLMYIKGYRVHEVRVEELRAIEEEW